MEWWKELIELLVKKFNVSSLPHVLQKCSGLTHFVISCSVSTPSHVTLLPVSLHQIKPITPHLLILAICAPLGVLCGIRFLKQIVRSLIRRAVHLFSSHTSTTVRDINCGILGNIVWSNPETSYLLKMFFPMLTPLLLLYLFLSL